MEIALVLEIPPDSSDLVKDLRIHDARMGRLFSLEMKTLQMSSANHA